MLAGIKSIKIIKKTGDTHGSWLKDPGKNYPKIYLLTGTKNKTMVEFANIRIFAESSGTRFTRRVNLPFPWQGTGHAIYHGFLFYHRYSSINEITKFDIQKRNVTDRLLLSGAGETSAYELHPSTKIDLAVDELGLWAVHSESNNGGTLVITKINHETMAVEHTWDTSCKSQNAEAAFMMCGVLYVVSNSPGGGTPRIECIYDPLDTTSTYETPMHFPKRQMSLSMVHYNPREKLLFAWDDGGSQIIYKLLIKQKN